MTNRRWAAYVTCWMALSTCAAHAAEPSHYGQQAREVTEHIQKTFYDPQSGVYLKSLTVRKPDYVWLQSVMFANLVAAARAEPAKDGPRLQKYFIALDRYWDPKVKIPGYEAAPTRGNGNDKYYDDNAWLVITFLEAYQSNHDPRYLARADATLHFVLSGWDTEAGGGIWWHQLHKDGTKNACANGPAAVGCLRLAKFRQGAAAAALVEQARQIVAWTRTKLQADDGLFEDRMVVATGEVKHGKLTYNSALVLRALLGLYRATGEKPYLDAGPADRESRRLVCGPADGRLSRRRPVRPFHGRGRSGVVPHHERGVSAQAGQEECGCLLREVGRLSRPTT